MGIVESYRNHLEGSGEPGVLAADLREIGLHLEAGMVEAPVAGSGTAVVRDPSSWLLGRRLWNTTLPPSDAGAGDVWFDPIEVAVMVLVTRQPMVTDGPPPRVGEGFDPRLAWLAIRPVLHFQYSAFLDLAELEPRAWEGGEHPPMFDRVRLSGTPADPVTRVAKSEAYLYARWFGKSLSSVMTWQAARSALPATGFAALWSRSAREWTSTSPVDDPDIGVVVSESDVDIDPDEIDLGDDEWLTPDAHESLFGLWDFAGDVGFRTEVGVQTGLLTVASYGDAIAAADVRLAAPLARS